MVPRALPTWAPSFLGEGDHPFALLSFRAARPWECRPPPLPMRTPDAPLSALRTPLTTLLARPGAARVVRALVLADHALLPAQLAGASGLSLPAVRAALRDAEATGFVRSFPEGRQGRIRSYQLRREHPLAGPIAALFEAEGRRAKGLFDDLRQAFTEVVSLPEHGAGRSTGGAPVAAWVYGPVAARSDAVGDPVLLMIAAPASVLAPLVDAFSPRAEAIAVRHVVTACVHGVANEVLRHEAHADARWVGLQSHSIKIGRWTVADFLTAVA